MFGGGGGGEQLCVPTGMERKLTSHRHQVLNIGSQLNQYTKQRAPEAWLLSCCQSIVVPLFAVRWASPPVSKVSHIPAFVGLPHIDHWPSMRPTEFPCISSQ
jgi:hypothetical protein